jgi:hypothetical protein
LAGRVGTINIWHTLANKELRMEDLRQKGHMPYETQSFSQSEVNDAGDSAAGDEAERPEEAHNSGKNDISELTRGTSKPFND